MLSHLYLGMVIILLLFVILLAMGMKVDWLIVLYTTVLSIIIIITIIAPAMVVQSPLIAVRNGEFNISKLIMLLVHFLFSDGQSTSSGGSSTSDDDSNVYPGVIAAGVIVFIIAGIVIVRIIIIVTRKKKSLRQLEQTGRVTEATLPQASVLHYTYPSVSSQAPVSNQPYPNLVHNQQQTPQASTGIEAAMTSISPQTAMSYPNYYGAGNAAAVGFTSNQSYLPDGNKPAIDPPPYSACIGERGPDGSTNNRSIFLPPDYASAVSTNAFVQVPPATNN